MVVCVCSESPSNNLVTVSTTHCSCQWLVVLNRLGHWLLHVCVCVCGGGGGFLPNPSPNVHTPSLLLPGVLLLHPHCSV